jgi:hypothetical protein
VTVHALRFQCLHVKISHTPQRCPVVRSRQPIPRRKDLAWLLVWFCIASVVSRAPFMMVVLCSVWQLATIVVRAQLRRTMITPTTAPSNALVSRQLCDSIAIVGS